MPSIYRYLVKGAPYPLATSSHPLSTLLATTSLPPRYLLYCALVFAWTLVLCFVIVCSSIMHTLQRKVHFFAATYSFFLLYIWFIQKKTLTLQVQWFGMSAKNAAVCTIPSADYIQNRIPPVKDYNI